MPRRIGCLMWMVTTSTVLLVVVLFTNTREQVVKIITRPDQSAVRNQTRTAPPRIDINPIPSDQHLSKLSHMDLQDLYHSYINSPQVTCSRVVRMGKVTDGGWELCDDPLYRPTAGSCLVYSYGINFDFTFDDAMAQYGCHVHAFDPSMGMESHLRGNRIYFHPTGVGGTNRTVPRKDKQPVPWQLYTIASDRLRLGHAPNKRRLDVVKMDVEGNEVESLEAALDDGSLDDVRQLAFETHAAWSKTDPTVEDYRKISVMGSLSLYNNMPLCYTFLTTAAASTVKELTKNHITSSVLVAQARQPSHPIVPFYPTSEFMNQPTNRLRDVKSNRYLGLLRKVWDHGFRIYLTHRNYVWSAFTSKLNPGKQFVHCHEIHTVNIRFAGDPFQTPSAAMRSGPVNQTMLNEDHQSQMYHLENERQWYRQFKTT